MSTGIGGFAAANVIRAASHWRATKNDKTIFPNLYLATGRSHPGDLNPFIGLHHFGRIKSWDICVIGFCFVKPSRQSLKNDEIEKNSKGADHAPASGHQGATRSRSQLRKKRHPQLPNPAPRLFLRACCKVFSGASWF
jgi:hypothetical protein